MEVQHMAHFEAETRSEGDGLMPLFACTSCDAIDNTAISGYWEQQLDAHHAKVEFQPKCSECHSGKWHGEFPKRSAKEAGYIPDPRMSGFVMPQGGWK